MNLNLGSWVSRTEAEGPGVRFAAWVQGCSIRCLGCVNPHLFADKPNRLLAPEALLDEVRAARAKDSRLEGVSLLGGEPFEQDVALARFAALVRAEGLTVMTYTGYLLEDLRARRSPLLDVTDLLVDGPYVAAQRETTRRFIGSRNQRLHFLTDAYRPDDPRFAEPNHAEIRWNAQGEVQVVGFPFDRFLEAFGPGKPKPPPV
jgi:anaerobic ribonucleoside-triphosphate reductase activating protein